MPWRSESHEPCKPAIVRRLFGEIRPIPDRGARPLLSVPAGTAVKVYLTPSGGCKETNHHPQADREQMRFT